MNLKHILRQIQSDGDNLLLHGTAPRRGPTTTTSLHSYAGAEVVHDITSLDTNTVERSIRPLALNCKNALFEGSDEGGDNWAVIATLIENCKITGINPHTWLTETLTKLADGHPATSVGDFMPWVAVG